MVYTPVNKNRLDPELFGSGRLFDVALHDYSGNVYTSIAEAEHQFAGPGHKWPNAKKDLAKLDQKYEFYAFVDNDIEVTTQQLNDLFLIGSREGLELFQPALTWNSYSFHDGFLWRPRFSRRPRKHNFIEIMTPFFSKAALEKCFESFELSESGYGLDYIWPTILGFDGLAVIDAVRVRHRKPISSHLWRLEGGLTPMEEYAQLIQKGIVTPIVPQFSRWDRAWARIIRGLQRKWGYYPT